MFFLFPFLVFLQICTRMMLNNLEVARDRYVILLPALQFVRVASLINGEIDQGDRVMLPVSGTIWSHWVVDLDIWQGWT